MNEWEILCNNNNNKRKSIIYSKWSVETKQ